MSFGLLINDETGAKALGTDDFTYNVIYSEVITLTAQQSDITITIPGFSAANCVFMVYHHRPDQVPGDSGVWWRHMLPQTDFIGPSSFRIRALYAGGDALGQYQAMAMRVY